jgi:hypothetical protein
MNTDINPGAPATDQEAAAKLAWDLNNLLPRKTRGDIEHLRSELFTSITWETDINANGVPVRRYVLRGEWEVDPQPPAYEPEWGDVVRFADRRDDGREWIVSEPQGADYRRLLSDPKWGWILISAPGADEVAERQWVRPKEIEIVRRPR